MRNLLARRPNTIFALLLAYFILAIIIRVARPGALSADDEEQAFLSQFLLLGYGKQPPLYNWLQYGLAEIIGLSVFSITFLKNALLCAFCFLYGIAARVVIRNENLAYIAMVGVLALPAVFLLSQRDLSHTVVALVAVALLLFAFFRILKEPDLTGYMLAGLAIGLGILSKYNFVIVPAAALIAMLPDPAFRRRLFDIRVLVAFLVAAIILAPHCYWLLAHHDQVTGSTLAEMKEGAEKAHMPLFILGVLSLAQATLFASAPPAAAFALIFRKDVMAIAKAGDRWTAVVGRMFVICILFVLVIMIGTGATHMREKWLIFFTALLPIYFALKVQAAGIDVKSRLAEMTALAAVLCIGALIAVHGGVIARHLMGRDSRHTVPYDKLATKLKQEGPLPTLFVASEMTLAGNMKLQLPSALFLYPGMPVPTPELSGEQKARVLLLWNNPAPPEPPSEVKDFAKQLTGSDNLTEVTQFDVPTGRGTRSNFNSFAYAHLGSAR
ncbi:glycosyltransferase family 39 protein [Oryzifoliimicrobium ureilyticus]|uniref:glycosyltransferase family 39 protein n=1 Tax=Oryzifoliimicrobium ureilyticus TaxID=3113724 RepID=UPI003076191E